MFKAEIAKALSEATGLDTAAVSDMLEIPPNPELGDYAFPCFRLAKTMRKAPALIAAELAETVKKPDCVGKVLPAGGYVNFVLDRGVQAKTVLEKIRTEGKKYGGSSEGGGRNVCIDYSSVNIAKPLHIGHLPSTVIGNSLYRIYEHIGYNSVGINHLGDWGTQFGKMIVAYRLWGNRETIEAGGVDELVKLYVRFHQEAERDESLNDQARAWFRKIEENDPEAMELFSWFKEITLKEVRQVFDMMGIRFDSYAGESFYNDKMDRVVDELREKHLLIKDQGAQIVDLSEYKMPPCIILRSDGATLYATRDIAAALYRKDTYDFAKCLYVVAYQQNLHFRQWFKVVELMGYDWAKDLTHVAFGMVSGTEGAFSTRKGNMVKLRDVLQASIDKTRAIIREKSPDLEDADGIAKEVGIGALVWSMLYNGRIKDVVFDWDTILNFDGETGPYVQYTHARACSVLRKAKPEGDPDYSLLNDDESRSLIAALGAFPDAVKEAAEKYEPYLVSRSVMQICQAFNRFYYEQRIMTDDAALRNARLTLTEAARDVIAIGLNLIGLSAPERM
ncbi:MAG: arginine--tRNA ligase [Clostridia bacterium]|nr:arginine--tRNA ligase [Clostridia bacterium]MBR0444881.1 arginine--tRNA ligase [Clostridia bacterium]